MNLVAYQRFFCLAKTLIAVNISPEVSVMFTDRLSATSPNHLNSISRYAIEDSDACLLITITVVVETCNKGDYDLSE